MNTDITFKFVCNGNVTPKRRIFTESRISSIDDRLKWKFGTIYIPFSGGHVLVRHVSNEAACDAVLLASLVHVRWHYWKCTVIPRLLVPIFTLQPSHRVIYEHRSAQACLRILDSPQFASGDLEQTAAFLAGAILGGDHCGSSPTDH